MTHDDVRTIERPCDWCDDTYRTEAVAESGGAPGEVLFDPDETRCPECRRRTRVFVYGSLRFSLGLHRAIDPNTSRFVGEGTLRGFSMVDLGGIPAIGETVLDGTSGEVIGEVYEVDADTLRDLDRIEGHPHYYRRVQRELTNGEVVDVYTYPVPRIERVSSYPPPLFGHSRVVSDGSWIARHLRQDHAALNDGRPISDGILTLGLQGQRALRAAEWGEGDWS